MADISITVLAPSIRVERRITPSWTLSQLKTKLEPVTGIPSSQQAIFLDASNASHALTNDDAPLSSWAGLPWHEGTLRVDDLRPPGMRPNYTDTSEVEKYVMPSTQYEGLSDSVLAYKRVNKFGRFNPDGKKDPTARFAAYADRHGIVAGKRCRIDLSDVKRGLVAFVGPVDRIVDKAGAAGEGLWVGVQLDEPLGKNDGSIEGTRYFDAGNMRGMFVRPERVEVGEFDVLPIEDDEDLEEI